MVLNARQNAISRHMKNPFRTKQEHKTMIRHGFRFSILSAVMGAAVMVAPGVGTAASPAMKMHDMQGMEHMDDMEGMDGMPGMTHHRAPTPHRSHPVRATATEQNRHPPATGPLGMPEAVRER